MHHDFRELGTATNCRRALIFIHGFQGYYRALGFAHHLRVLVSRPAIPRSRQ